MSSCPFVRVFLAWPGRRGAAGILAVLGLASFAAPGAGQTQSETLGALRDELAALRSEYGARLQALEARIAAIESGTEVESEILTAPTDELAALQAAAEALAVDEESVAVPPPTTAAPAIGGERNLNRLNPEISFTGDVLALARDTAREEFQAREIEIAFQTTLDPFTVAKFSLAVGPEEGEVELEEGYATFNRIGHGLQLSAGKMRQQIGVLNRWHQHALPQSDYPLVLQRFFGDEGLTQTGLSLGWLMPQAWADANELTLQLTNAENEAFAGADFERLSGLAHLKSYWDLDASTYFEWGLSAIVGKTENGGTSRVLGTDLTLHWQPPWRARSRELTLRTELLRSERDDSLGVRHEATGLYAYVESVVRRNLALGLRYDWVEDPWHPDHVTWALIPGITWWQSEFVRVRAEYGFERDRLRDEEGNRFGLQLTFSAGPHKHESY